MNHKRTEIKNYLRDRVKELKEYDEKRLNQLIKDGDLHNEIFGTYEAKKWLGNFAFEAIDKIKEYEEDNFGEVNTDLSDPEKVVNMYVYIIGEELIYEIGSKYL